MMQLNGVITRKRRAVEERMELLKIRDALEEALRLADERYEMSTSYEAFRNGQADWNDVESHAALVDAGVAFTLRQIVRSGFEAFQNIAG